MIRGLIQTTGDAFDPGRLDSETKAVYREALTAAGLELEGIFRRDTPFGVVGALQKAWFTEYDDDLQQVIVANPMEYALAVEEGRKPKFPPTKPIELWVKVHITRQEKTKTVKGKTTLGYKAIAFLIARKKSKEPTPGQGFVKKAFEASIDSVNANYLQPIGAEIVRRLAQ